MEKYDTIMNKKCTTVVSPFIKPPFLQWNKSFIRGMTFFEGAKFASILLSVHGLIRRVWGSLLEVDYCAWTDKKGVRELIRGRLVVVFFLTMGSIYYYVDKRSKIGKGLVMIRAIFDLYFWHKIKYIVHSRTLMVKHKTKLKTWFFN